MPREMALCQEKPIVPGVLARSAAGFNQSLLQARQRPVPGPLRQTPPPQIPQLIGNDGEPQPHVFGPEPMTAQPRHLHRLLAFFDPLLRCPSLVVESHHRPTQQRQVRHNEPVSQ